MRLAEKKPPGISIKAMNVKSDDIKGVLEY